LALAPLLWIHAFRIVGGTILAPGAVDATVPSDFRMMIGLGDMATAVLALLALIALRRRMALAIPLVWLVLAVGLDLWQRSRHLCTYRQDQRRA